MGWIDNYYFTISNGGRTATATQGLWRGLLSDFDKTSGKWYWEIEVTVDFSNTMIGVGQDTAPVTSYVAATAAGWEYHTSGNGNPYKFHSSTGAVWGSTYGLNDIIGVAVDVDAGKVWWSKNGVWQESGDPAAGTNEAYSGLTGTLTPSVSAYSVGTQYTANWTSSQQTYSAPTGFESIALLTTTLDSIIAIEDSYFSKVLASNPAAYWRLNGSVKDEFGTASTGYNIKDINTISSDISNSIEFNGTNSYIEAVTPQHSGSWTIELIFKIDELPNGTILLAEQYTGSGDIIPYALCFSNSGSFGSGNKLSGGFYTGSTWVLIYDTEDITLGIHHAVCVYDGSVNQLVLYLDGEQVAISGTGIAAAVNDNNTLYIGKRWDTTSPQYFKGAIDSVAIYTSALSAATVLDHAALGITPVAAIDSIIVANNSYWHKILIASPMAYWRLGNDQVEQYGTDTTYYNTESTESLVHDSDSSQYFNGTNAYVACENPQFTTSWSIEMVFEATVTPNGTKLLAEQFTGSGDRINWTIFFTNNGTVDSGSNLTVGYYTGSAWVSIWDTANTTIGKYHVVGIYDGTVDQLILYVNGEQVAISATGLAPCISDNNTLYIGKRWDGIAPAYFEGKIDEVAIYDEVLTESVILDHSILALAPTVSITALLTKDNDYFSDVVNSNPLAYYRLDDLNSTIVDCLYGNNGVYTGSPTLSEPSLLQNDDNTAVTFIGTGQYATLVDDPLDITGDITVEAIVKTTLNVSTSDFIVNKYSLSNDAGWHIYIKDGIVRFSIRAGTGSYIDSGSGNNTVISDGKPHHILGMRDGSTVRIYVDGSLTTENTGISTGSFANTKPAEIATYWSDRSLSFDGTIDEVAIYDRALTEAEVYSHSILATGDPVQIDALLYTTHAYVSAEIYVTDSSIDSILSKTVSIDASADAHLEKNVSISSDIASLLALRQIKDVSLDVITDAMNAVVDSSLLGKDTKLTDIDSVLYSSIYIVPPVDAVLKGSNNKVVNIGALLQAEISKSTNIIGTLIPVTGIWSKLTIILDTKTSKIDGVLSANIPKTADVDSMLGIRNTKAISIDGIIYSWRESITGSLDVVLYATDNITLGIDASLIGTIDKVGLVDSVLIIKQDISSEVESILLKVVNKYVSIDGRLTSTSNFLSEIDANLLLSGILSSVNGITTPIIVGERDIWHYSKGIITHIEDSSEIITKIENSMEVVTKVSYTVGVITKVSNEVNI